MSSKSMVRTDTPRRSGERPDGRDLEPDRDLETTAEPVPEAEAEAEAEAEPGGNSRSLKGDLTSK